MTSVPKRSGRRAAAQHKMAPPNECPIACILPVGPPFSPSSCASTEQMMSSRMARQSRRPASMLGSMREKQSWERDASPRARSAACTAAYAPPGTPLAPTTATGCIQSRGPVGRGSLGTVPSAGGVPVFPKTKNIRKRQDSSPRSLSRCGRAHGACCAATWRPVPLSHPRVV